jgi:hypothetical protein
LAILIIWGGRRRRRGLIQLHRVEPDDRLEIDYPVVIPLPVDHLAKTRKLWSRILKLVFALVGALLVYPFGLANFGDSATTVFVILLGAFGGGYIASQIVEIKEIPVGSDTRTRNREVIIERDRLKISRSLLGSREEFHDDEIDYYVIFLDATCSIRLEVLETPHSSSSEVGYSIRQDGRTLFIKTRWLGRSERVFVTALKQFISYD